MMKSLPEPEGARPLPRRLEWDEANECFALSYTSTWTARLRCECRFGLEQPALGAAMALTLPISLPVLAGALMLNSSPTPSRLCIFAWGLSDSTPRLSVQARWPEIRRISRRGHDLFVSWRTQSNPAVPGCYFPRECFADEDEALFCHEMLLGLWQSQGQSWSLARSRLLARQTLRQGLEQSLEPITPPDFQAPLRKPVEPYLPSDAEDDPFA